jgi:hypothetical protein
MSARAFPPLAAAAGLFSVVVWIFASFVADLPSIDSRAVAIANYFDDEHVSVVTSVYFEGLALVCFLFFLAGLAVGLDRAGERWLAATQLGAGVTLVALLGTSAIVLGALAWRATDAPFVAQSVFDLALLSHTFSFFPLAAAVAAGGLGALRDRRSPPPVRLGGSRSRGHVPGRCGDLWRERILRARWRLLGCRFARVPSVGSRYEWSHAPSPAGVFVLSWLLA